MTSQIKTNRERLASTYNIIVLLLY